MTDFCLWSIIKLWEIKNINFSLLSVIRWNGLNVWRDGWATHWPLPTVCHYLRDWSLPSNWRESFTSWRQLCFFPFHLVFFTFIERWPPIGTIMAGKQVGGPESAEMPFHLWELVCGLQEKSGFMGALKILQHQSLQDIIGFLALQWWQRKGQYGKRWPNLNCPHTAAPATWWLNSWELCVDLCTSPGLGK